MHPIEKMEQKKDKLQEALAVLPQSELAYVPTAVSEELQMADYYIGQAQYCIACAQSMFEEALK